MTKLKKTAFNIIVEPKNHYGRKLFYPVCEQARNWLTILRRKECFTEKDLENLKNMNIGVTYGFSG